MLYNVNNINDILILNLHGRSDPSVRPINLTVIGVIHKGCHLLRTSL